MALKDDTSTIRLAEILGALSHALDLTEGQPPGHCIRCTWIGTRIGETLGLSGPELHDLYYTLLLKDLGCSSNAARLCELYLTDDRTFKREFKEIDDGLAQVLGFILKQTGLKAGLAERFRAIVHIVRNGGEIARDLIETRCQRGASIARRLRFSEAVALAITGLDEHWNGRGQPLGLAGEAIPLYSRIALVAQVADVFHRSGGPAAALKQVRRRAGNWFDPDLVAAFETAAAVPGFWEALVGDDLEQRVLTLDPAQRSQTVDEDYLDDIAQAFAEVVDSKSPYTNGHSERVALFADLIAETLGLPAAERRRLRRAALLHDIGKLAVSNAILDKPGRLDAAEWAEIREHPVHSRRILSQIGPFADLARIGGDHHERLDGMGYPNGLAGEAINLGTRIVTVADIFDALTADRPYRPALPLSGALAILEADIGIAVDGRCVDALKAAIGALDAPAAHAAA